MDLWTQSTRSAKLVQTPWPGSKTWKKPKLEASKVWQDKHFCFVAHINAKQVWIIEGFTVADAILVVGQTRQNLQWMYGKSRDFDAR